MLFGGRQAGRQGQAATATSNSNQQVATRAPCMWQQCSQERSACDVFSLLVTGLLCSRSAGRTGSDDAGSSQC